jgi:hypothetical protein
MNQVIFTFKNGRQRTMHRSQAAFFAAAKQGTYSAKEQPTVEAPTPKPSADKAGAADIDAMDADALHVLARERGVKVHHKAGADKVREALRQAKA